jgi:hypothetical protein
VKAVLSLFLLLVWRLVLWPAASVGHILDETELLTCVLQKELLSQEVMKLRQQVSGEDSLLDACVGR